MVVLTESSSNESLEFIVIIQHVISSASSFIDCLEFIPESNLSLTGFDMCFPRYLIYLIFPSLRVMLRVSTVLHLLIARDDNITRHIAVYNDNYKFTAYSYSILQKFTIDNNVIVTSHSETVRKLHT